MSQGTFDTTSFAEGRFRRAYMGKYTAPWYKAGQECVVKELKENYTWNASDWTTTIEVHEEAQRLAEQFNQYLKIPGVINFTKVAVLPVTTQASFFKRPKLNEYVIVEDYISGEFKK